MRSGPRQAQPIAVFRQVKRIVGRPKEGRSRQNEGLSRQKEGRSRQKEASTPNVRSILSKKVGNWISTSGDASTPKLL